MGQPVHRLLGTHRESIPIYKSDREPGESGGAGLPEEYAEDVIRWKELGWKGYEYHSARGPERNNSLDLAVLTKIREAAGDDMKVMFDAHAYGFGDAVRVGKAIEEMGYFWYEDPLPPRRHLWSSEPEGTGRDPDPRDRDDRRRPLLVPAMDHRASD